MSAEMHKLRKVIRRLNSRFSCRRLVPSIFGSTSRGRALSSCHLSQFLISWSFKGIFRLAKTL